MNKTNIKTIIAFGLFGFSINAFGDYTNIETKEAEIKITTPLSGLVIGAGELLSQKMSDENFLNMLNKSTESGYSLEKANSDLLAKMENFKEKINKYLLTNTLKQKSYFRTGESQLPEREVDYLTTIINSIDNIGELKIKLIGYADPRGDETYNYNLSKSRVKNTTRLLTQLGVNEENIEEYYKGERGKEKGRNTEDFFFDRLVEIYIYK